MKLNGIKGCVECECLKKWLWLLKMVVVYENGNWIEVVVVVVVVTLICFLCVLFGFFYDYFEKKFFTIKK